MIAVIIFFALGYRMYKLTKDTLEQDVEMLEKERKKYISFILIMVLCFLDFAAVLLLSKNLPQDTVLILAGLAFLPLISPLFLFIKKPLAYDILIATIAIKTLCVLGFIILNGRSLDINSLLTSIIQFTMINNLLWEKKFKFGTKEKTEI